jgi:hypothetical protein
MLPLTDILIIIQLRATRDKQITESSVGSREKGSLKSRYIICSLSLQGSNKKCTPFLCEKFNLFFPKKKASLFQNECRLHFSL